MNKIQENKIKFLEKYNPDYSIKVAITNSIKAAVQHNILYSTNTNLKDRAGIRSYWSECLEEIGWEFRKDVQIKYYEEIILKFQKHMNLKFKHHFESDGRYASMFRVSHSQKSISVFVKYLWCMDKIDEPKICPVDRVILSQTGAKLKKDMTWCEVNSIEEHRRKFNYIAEAAKNNNSSIANWELLKFTN